MAVGEKRGPSLAAGVIERYGKCRELIPMDARFHNISIGLYEKEGTCTVWTFSRHEGAEDRVEQIREQLVALGGMVAVAGTRNQARFPCGMLHVRPVRFLIARAVAHDPEQQPPSGEIKIRDTKSKLELIAVGHDTDRGAVYRIGSEGEAPNASMRLKSIVRGFVRYGEMETMGEGEVAFPCGQRHDELVRLLLPYSRNISAVESEMEAEAQRGQMTTSTLGFSQT